MTVGPASKLGRGAAYYAETGEVALKPLFNRSEQEMFRQLETCVAEMSSGYRVFGQVALAEIVRTASRYEKGSALAHGTPPRLRRLRPRLQTPRRGRVPQGHSRLALTRWGHETKRVQATGDVKRTLLARVGVPLLVIDGVCSEAARKQTMIGALLGAVGNLMAQAIA